MPSASPRPMRAFARSKGVSFDLRPGEVHALVGENGAGKSTLIKIITGAERPDAGTLRVAGREVPHMDPATAHALGIAAIYQQPALFPHLTVAENVALALERAGLWRKVDWRRRHEAASALLAGSDRPSIPARTVDTLSMPEQQIVEIAKAIGVNARIVVMDEPTASLTEPRSRAALSGHRPAARGGRRRDLHLAPARGDLRGRGSDHRASRRLDRGDAGGVGRRARRADSIDGRPRDLGRVPEGADRDRCAGARGRRAHERAPQGFGMCR